MTPPPIKPGAKWKTDRGRVATVILVDGEKVQYTVEGAPLTYRAAARDFRMVYKHKVN